MAGPRLQHASMVIPPGMQDAVRTFYGEVLGLEEKQPPGSPFASPPRLVRRRGGRDGAALLAQFHSTWRDRSAAHLPRGGGPGRVPAQIDRGRSGDTASRADSPSATVLLLGPFRQPARIHDDPGRLSRGTLTQSEISTCATVLLLS
jgi:hypothetical protein